MEDKTKETVKPLNIHEKLMNIQNELKAPKNQRNTFGNYNYRNCEDILEAIKPLCKENKAVLKISDEIELVGTRFYIKATATLIDAESGEKISNTAFAREEENKKGMDGSQITGTASSYARKYALNGLFCIDDTKDADTNEFNDTTKKCEDTPRENKNQVSKITDKQKEMIKNIYTTEEIKQELETLRRSKLSELTVMEASSLISKRKKEEQ